MYMYNSMCEFNIATCVLLLTCSKKKGGGMTVVNPETILFPYSRAYSIVVALIGKSYNEI